MGLVAEEAKPDQVTVHHTATVSDLGEELRRFWELESVPTTRRLSPDDQFCEKQFRETHYRDGEGRFVVRLPRRSEPPTELGASRRGALQLLLSAERRMERNPTLRQKYSSFLAEYLSMGHMEPVSSAEGRDCCYLPHHAVFKTSDPAGKVRVVFNTAFRTTLGASLNDTLLPGPKLQPDLWAVLGK